ncbi:hypothetical protein ACIRN4_02090 [Pimelobacter simplex]|uniref:hypothetical protein n=1 Tax=Nocardioides simplex TaxID=2045 RepID=UPI003804ABF2
MGSETQPGSADTLPDFYRAVPAADAYDAPPTPGQAQGLVEHVLEAEVIDEPEPDADPDPDPEA